MHYYNVINKFNEDLLKQNDFELNTLDYDETILLGKRNFCEYYTSLIMFFSFGCREDYNLEIIKMFFFFSLLDLNSNS